MFAASQDGRRPLLSHRAVAVALGVVLAYAAVLLLDAPRSLARSDVATATCLTGSQTLQSTGETCYSVGTGVDHLLITVVGAPGGTDGWSSSTAALGSQTQAIVPVSSGETLYADVGGAGGNAKSSNFQSDVPGGAGGWNGGAGGGSTAPNANGVVAYQSGGGGGGASDVTAVSESMPAALIVAGGGGGQGGQSAWASGAGGTGGGAGGTGGFPCSFTNPRTGAQELLPELWGGGGGHGGASSGGAAGTTSGLISDYCPATGTLTNGNVGGSGSQGSGGTGATETGVAFDDAFAGGGGGGGWQGGGGGAAGSFMSNGPVGAGGGGGAGSSYIESQATDGSTGTAPNATAEVTISPVSVPSAPSGVSAVSGGPGKASVSFTAPASNGGMPITSYTVVASDQTNPSAAPVTTNGTASPIVVPGLTSGHEYDFQVAASNAVGIGPESTSSTPYLVPATATTTTVSPSANPATVGQQVTYTATVSPTPDGGTVAFTDAGSQIPGCGAQAVSTTDGTATCKVTYASTGAHSIMAAYSGDPSFGASSTSSAVNETINPISTATTVAAAPNPATVGQPVTYTATVSPIPDGGTVAFTDGGTTITGCGAQNVSTSDGTATCQVTYTTAGSHTVNASYAGDANYTGSTSTTAASETVGAASTATTVAAAPKSPTVGDTVTYTATVSPIPDGGTVAFTDGGTTITGCGAQNVSTSDGTATCQVTYTTAGSHTVNASYAGDSNYSSSTSPTPATETVSAGAPTGSGSGTPSGGTPTTTTTTTTTPPATTPVVAPTGATVAPSAAGKLKLVSGPSVSRTGAIIAKVTCSGASPCRVSATLATVVTTAKGRSMAVSARVKVHHTTLVDGAQTVTVADGSTVTVTITLNAKARHLLAEVSHLPALLTVVCTSQGTRTTVAQRKLVIKPARKPKHSKH